MRSTKLITEGALMLAIFIVLLLISLYIPLLWVISSLFLILPFLVYSTKYPLQYSVLLVVASVVVSLVAGGPTAAPLALSYSTTGVVIGTLIQKKQGKFSLYVAGSFTFLLNLIIQYVVAITVFNMNFIEQFTTMFKESFEQSAKMMEGLGQTVPEGTAEQLETSLDMIQTLLPSMLVLSSFAIVLVLIAVNFPILKRLGLDVPVFQPFRDWQLPKSILWYYLILLIAAIIAAPEIGTMWHSAYTNLMFMLQMALFIQGLTFIYFYAYEKKWSKFLPIMVTIFSIIFLPLLYIVRLLGIIDLGFDLRQRLRQKP